MKNILILSKDEKFKSKIFNRINRELYNLAMESDAEKVKGLLNEAQFSLAIVDLEDEGENEVFLRYLKINHPRIIRMAIMDSLHPSDYNMPKKQNSAKMNWKKNADDEELLGIIDKVIAIDERVNNSELVNVVSNFKHMPTVPQIYNELNILIQENASVEEIALKLEEDPAVTSNILKMANSAFYNAKTGSIRQAIMYIGLINVKNIILTNAVFGNDGLDSKIRKIHWDHVSMTNKILNAMYVELLGKKLNNNISSVGLLHDVGSIVFMSNFPVEFNKIVKKVNEKKGLSFSDMERDLVGFNHEELGGHLLDLWGLPYPIIEAALYHHDPFNQQVINRELVVSMHIANFHAWKIMGSDEFHEPLDNMAFAELKITQRQFDVFFENLKRKL